MYRYIRPIRTMIGTAYLIPGDGGYVLMDTLSPGVGWLALQSLKRMGITLDQIKLILLSHGHIDHIGNADLLRRKTGAPIAIHENDVEAPRRGCNMKLYPRNTFETLFGFFTSRIHIRPFEPDILLSGDEGNLDAYGSDARWVRTPGHTEGSVSLVVPGVVAMVGDLVIGRFSLTKTPAYPLWVRNGQQLKDSVSRLLGYHPRVFLSGHGGPLDPEAVRRVFLKR